jgi:hypothetical protein
MSQYYSEKSFIWDFFSSKYTKADNTKEKNANIQVKKFELCGFDIYKQFDQVKLVKRRISGNPNSFFLHWGFMFIQDKNVVLIDYSKDGLNVKWFSKKNDLKLNTNEAFSQFRDRSSQVYFKNMSESEWKSCTIVKLVDHINDMMNNLGYKEYNHVTKNCQTFVLDLAQPFDQYADKVKRGLSNLKLGQLLSEIIMNPFELSRIIIGSLEDDYSHYYECETNLGMSSLAKRFVSTGMMDIWSRKDEF